MQHRFFSRHGGVSHGLWASLNTSYHVGDEPGAVTENRRLIKEQLGVSRLVSSRQVHGDHVFVDVCDGTGDLEVDGYDALITARTDTALLIQQADCQAVLLHDLKHRVVAAVHCGWRGSVANVIGKTVAVLTSEFRTDPAGLEAYIGPSLGPCCAEFVNHRQELPASFRRFQEQTNHFDFWSVSRWQLTEAGLRLEQIHVTTTCTRCSTAYFSYRRTRQSGAMVTGRHGSVICL